MSFGIKGAVDPIAGQVALDQLPMDLVKVYMFNADTAAKSAGDLVHVEYSSGNARWEADVFAAADVAVSGAVCAGFFGVCLTDMPASKQGWVALKGYVSLMAGGTVGAGAPFTGELDTTGKALASAADDDKLILGVAGEAALADGSKGNVYFDGFAKSAQNA